MVITDFYYLSYPDTLPTDPLYAASEVRVEIKEEDSKYDFDFCYSFKFYTLKYIENEFVKEKKAFFYNRSIVIVEKFTDEVVKQALLDILLKIDLYGMRIE